MSYLADRELATLNRRLDMAIARGTLTTTSDGSGVQTAQVSLMSDEVLDGVERFQSYGLSAVPPDGSEVLVICLQCNRDQPHIIAVNHRGSRPKGLKPGEVVLYNDHDCYVALSLDGDVFITGARHVAIESVENLEITAGENLTISAGQAMTISAGQSIAMTAPLVTINGVQVP
ncbi:MAG TPA: phage baseplate assembly protein V [Acetobacteraceae bacterium]|jgi:phage baseplate assembly protein V|nr:phage baseplate assembly protein V [Acetobacteraceae bacterium]